MLKKVIAHVLIFSLLNYIGCTSTIYVTVDEHKPEELKAASPLEIFVTTIDESNFYFNNEEYYYFRNDTLFARGTAPEYYLKDGKKIETGKMKVIGGIIPPSDIKSFEFTEPNEIRLISRSGNEYNFINKGYYYVADDSIYGQGRIYSEDSLEYFEGVIAFSDIKSIHSGMYFSGEYDEEHEENIKMVKEDENYGIEVFISQRDGNEIYGELLSVRDSSIVICAEYEASEQQLANHVYPIVVVENDKIQEIILVDGFSYVFIGTVAGFFAGMLVGSLAASIIYADDRSEMVGYGYAIVGGIAMLLGLGIGAAVGSGASYDSIILTEIPPDYDFSALKSMSRYQFEEPDFLKNYKSNN